MAIECVLIFLTFLVVPKLRYFCPKGKFTCRDFACISIIHRCDGEVNCPHDRSDEEGCRRCFSTSLKRCRDSEFRLLPSLSLSISPFLMLLFLVACLHDKWQCDDGTCIGRELRCNGNLDCPDDISDERNCEGEAGKIEYQYFILQYSRQYFFIRDDASEQ